jgi:hypothetical protein
MLVPQRPLPATGGGPFKFRQLAIHLALVQTNLDVLGATNFYLAQISNQSNFTALFDQYKIDYLEYTFRPQANATTLVTTSTVPRFITAIDYDDSNTPGSLAALEEYMSAETHFTDTFTRRFRPKILTMIWDGSNPAPGGSTTAPWIDCAQNLIPHYGLKYGIEAGSVAQTAFQTWFMDLYVGISFRNVR